MIELRVYASLLSRRARTLLLTVRSVTNCRDFRLWKSFRRQNCSSNTSLQNTITRTSSGKCWLKDECAYKKIGGKLLLKRTRRMRKERAHYTRKLTEKSEISFRIGGIHRQSSNASSTIGLDRQIPTRKSARLLILMSTTTRQLSHSNVTKTKRWRKTTGGGNSLPDLGQKPSTRNQKSLRDLTSRKKI